MGAILSLLPTLDFATFPRFLASDLIKLNSTLMKMANVFHFHAAFSAAFSLFIKSEELFDSENSCSVERAAQPRFFVP